MDNMVVRLAELPEPDIVEVYEQILRPAFRPHELLDFEDFVATYAGTNAEPSGVLIAHGRPVAVLLADMYVDDRVVLLAYLAVAENLRSQGAGSMLLDDLAAQMRSQGRELITVAEVDDPRVWPGDARTGDARARLRFYEHRGARLIPVTYVQPRLRGSDPRVRGMFLIRLDGVEDVAKESLGRFLVEYFTACEGPTALEDPDIIRLLRQVEALDAGQNLPPLCEWQSTPLTVLRP